jgi:hypothetical protein
MNKAEAAKKAISAERLARMELDSTWGDYEHGNADLEDVVFAQQAVDAAILVTDAAIKEWEQDSKAVDAIARVLDGQVWDSDTPSTVAEIVRKTGREVDDLYGDD